MAKMCICGYSKTHPVCDGTHKTINNKNNDKVKTESENGLDALGREKFWEDIG